MCLIVSSLAISTDIGGQVRSYRHKSSRSCATDCLYIHIAGWKIYYMYDMQSKKDHKYDEQFYKIRNYRWWEKVHRIDWRLKNDGYNIEYFKWRIGHQYEMRNLNHEY